MARSSTSRDCDVIVDVCDWPIMPCGNGRLLHPDANTDYVRTFVLCSQVCSHLPDLSNIENNVLYLLFSKSVYCNVCCFRAETAVLTDDRIRTMNEVISGIRVIKMYGWEKPFGALVDEVRRYTKHFIENN